MKNPELVIKTKEIICQELNSAGFELYEGHKFIPSEHPSMKDFLERTLVYDRSIYSFLEGKNLIHFNYCLICGETINNSNKFSYEFFGRKYYMCEDCYKSASSRKKQKEGCYIATMCYGDYNHPDVLILRNFRDNTLAKHALGKNFIKIYYLSSPKIVAYLKGFKPINTFIKLTILKPTIALIKKFNKY